MFVFIVLIVFFFKWSDNQMKGILLTLATGLLAASSLFAQLPSDSVLRRYAAGMLMVGFKGDSVTENCDAARYVRDRKSVV